MNLPTFITLSRVLIAPVFAYFFVRGYHNPASTTWIWICVSIAIAIELTDLFDGRIARARNQVTDFGKVFDPVADSLSRQTIFLSFMVSGIIPFWMYLIFFYRDAFLQLLRIICASSGFVLAARPSGKAKAVLQGMGSFAVLAVVALQAYHISWLPQKIWGYHPGFWVMVIPALFTLLSVIDYVIPNRGMIMKMLEVKKQ
jgi:CDP-diacylglycerol---glycerol-3-phosphate 3-phosphatidyltransferase